MKDERLRTEAEDDRDAAVIAADDTGMIAGERLITEAEIDEGLQDEES